MRLIDLTALIKFYKIKTQRERAQKLIHMSEIICKMKFVATTC